MADDAKQFKSLEFWVNLKKKKMRKEQEKIPNLKVYKIIIQITKTCDEVLKLGSLQNEE